MGGSKWPARFPIFLRAATLDQRKERRPRIARTEWAYIAGFLEADGWVWMRSKPGQGLGCTVGFVQADAGVASLDFIASKLDELGLRYARGRYQQTNRSWSPRNQLVIKHQDSLRTFLEGVMPYLIQKRDPARQVLRTLADRRARHPLRAQARLPAPTTNVYWTVKEVKTLRALIGQDYNNVAIAQRMRRTVDSVSHKRMRLKAADAARSTVLRG